MRDELHVRLVACVQQYFEALDRGLAHLSRGQEGVLSRLPRWALARRTIRLGTTPDGEIVALRADPDPAATQDTVIVEAPLDDARVESYFSPISLTPPLAGFSKLGRDAFVLVGEAWIGDASNPLVPPFADTKHLAAIGWTANFSDHLNREAGLTQALDLWNTAANGLPPTANYISETRRVLDRAHQLPRRKEFLERRVHRFLNSHARLLLPAHTRKLYEHELRCGSEVRRADFILKRESGFPALLVELESPNHRVLTKRGDLTAHVTHAVQQITEWVAFIDTDGATNAAGEFLFLAGPKERLVVIGRGLEHAERLVRERFAGVVVWTYDILLAQARQRLNQEYEAQCHLIGLPATRPF